MKFKKLNLIVIGMILVITAGGLTFAVQNNNSSDSNTNKTAINPKSEKKPSDDEKLNEFIKKSQEYLESKKDERMKKDLAESYGKSEMEIQKMKDESGNWKNVSAKLFEQKNDKSLTEEKVLELRDKGYSTSDIDMAEQLASKCDKTTEEILSIKGKTSDYNQKLVNKGKVTNDTDIDNSKSWDEVCQILNIDTRTPAERVGVSKEQVEQLKKDGLREESINNAALLTEKYDKSFENIISEMKNGKKIDELENQYIKEQMNKPENKELNEKRQKAAEENALKRQFGVTEDMISECHKHGIEGINIIVIKNLVDKYNVTVEKVLSIYDEKKDLELLIQEMGGM